MCGQVFWHFRVPLQNIEICWNVSEQTVWRFGSGLTSVKIWMRWSFREERVQS